MDDAYITRDMKTEDMLKMFPEAREIFEENGMLCMGCMCAEAETVEEALAIHCMDIDAVIDAINGRIRDNRERENA